MIHFTANEVVVDRSRDEFILVGFAELRNGDCRDALHFQRSYNVDQQDVVLGLNQVYVERCDQSRSCYGGIRRVELRSASVTVLFSDSNAEILGDNQFEIELAVTPATFDDIASGLAQIFADSDIFSVADRWS